MIERILMMSKHSSNKKVEYQTVYVPIQQNDCLCNLRYLTILILIILQFSNHHKKYRDKNRCCGEGTIDNGILFIIALYFLTCC
ncbi:hypothetical protein IAI10_10590 [Clostridium sp. 19966]|uniref:hypothetical protein n=1 Tax=Clostridium sp. 19966 TaxID=2768166 RepID=UPI0028DEC078|nr:hypothetical protein [Clostridium sp. 19966]MDT8717105.1 hypothetical protein [Clostridium sp. 19966]